MDFEFDTASTYQFIVTMDHATLESSTFLNSSFTALLPPPSPLPGHTLKPIFSEHCE